MGIAIDQRLRKLLKAAEETGQQIERVRIEGNAIEIIYATSVRTESPELIDWRRPKK